MNTEEDCYYSLLEFIILNDIAYLYMSTYPYHILLQNGSIEKLSNYCFFNECVDALRYLTGEMEFVAVDRKEKILTVKFSDILGNLL